MGRRGTGLRVRTRNTHKRCLDCGRKLPLNCFHLTAKTDDHLSPQCLDCLLDPPLQKMEMPDGRKVDNL